MKERQDTKSLLKVIKRPSNNPIMKIVVLTGKQKQTAKNTYSNIQMHLHKSYKQANWIYFSWSASWLNIAKQLPLESISRALIWAQAEFSSSICSKDMQF